MQSSTPANPPPESASRQVLTTRQLVVIAVWLGLLAGLGESVMTAVRHHWLGRGLSYNPHGYWTKPLVEALLFTVMGLGYAAITCRWHAARSLRVVVAVFGMAAVFGVLHGVPGLHRIAVILVAIGGGVQLSRMATARQSGFERMVRRTAPWLVAGWLVLLVGTWAWRALPEYRAQWNRGEARPGAPNVILIVLDTVRASSLSLHGYERSTSPQLEQFAEDAVQFDRAFSTAPWTLPSHASMFTGRQPHELFGGDETPIAGYSPLGSAEATLAELLTEHGYSTAGFVGNMVYCSRAHGLDRGFGHYEDYIVSLPAALSSSTYGSILARRVFNVGTHEPVDRRRAAHINQAFLSWLDDREDPFFAFLNYYDAHGPYIAPEPFELRFGTEKIVPPWLGVSDEIDPPRIQRFQDAYDSCIAYLDDQLGVLFDELDRRGILDNTVVVVTSDHGEHFGEHGYLVHGNTLYRPLLHVPLLISFRGRLEPRKVAAPVSLLDLPATILDLLELDVEWPGESLSHHWRGGTAESADPLFAELLIRRDPPSWWMASWPWAESGLQSAIGSGHQYIRYERDGAVLEELYDLDEDAETEQNLVGSPERKAVLEELRAAMQAFREN